jgi:predicted  nucleic acid-binding Zn-ribbon protein
MRNTRQEIDGLHREIDALRSELNAIQRDLDEAMEIIAELTFYEANNDSIPYTPSEPEADISETDTDTPDARRFEITLPTRDQVVDSMAEFASDVIDFSNDINQRFREIREEKHEERSEEENNEE